MLTTNSSFSKYGDLSKTHMWPTVALDFPCVTSDL